MSQPTKSELAFEDYLNVSGIQFIKIKEEARPTPDFRVEIAGEHVFIEVKELGRPNPFPSGGFSPLPYIQRRIRKGREQFDRYRDYPCGVLLFNEESIVASLDPLSMLSAMFGENIESCGRESFAFGGTALFHAQSNRTISAVVSLVPLAVHPMNLRQAREISSEMRRLGRSLTDAETRTISNGLRLTPCIEASQPIYRAVVFHNPFASRPLPREMFLCVFDEWWEKRGDEVACTFRGARLTELWEALPDYALQMMGLMQSLSSWSI